MSSTENIIPDNINENAKPNENNYEIPPPENGLPMTKNSFKQFKANNSGLIRFLISCFVFVIISSYFLWASYWYANHSTPKFSSTMCNGYGFLVILYCFYIYGFMYVYFLKPILLPIVYRRAWKPIVRRLNSVKYGSYIFYAVFLAAVIAYLIYDTQDNRNRLIPISGLAVFMFIGYAISANRRLIPWRTIVWGLITQFLFGLLTIRWDAGRNVFDCVGDKVNIFLGYAVNGTAFVYGDFLIYDIGVFAFKALATIFFLGFMINIFYFYGIMQKVVGTLGEFLEWVMGTTICESVNSAANIFLGQTEAPLLLKPYLKDLTDSELHSIMTSGFATVSGTVMAAYISFGANPSDLITSSVMSAPAALCFSKTIYPETEKAQVTKHTIQQVEMEYVSVLDAAAKGASDAFHLVSGITSSLIAFIAFIYFVNGVLGWMGELVGFTGPDEIWTVELILGKIFIPISYVMGVPWDECELVGQLIGIKTMVNEFAAFERMSKMALSPRTKVIATYAICGFANPGSIGIMISGLSTLVPNKREAVTRLVFRAFVGGCLVCFMTACIAAVLIPDSLIK